MGKRIWKIGIKRKPSRNCEAHFLALAQKWNVSLLYAMQCNITLCKTQKPITREYEKMKCIVTRLWKHESCRCEWEGQCSESTVGNRSVTSLPVNFSGSTVWVALGFHRCRPVRQHGIWICRVRFQLLVTFIGFELVLTVWYSICRPSFSAFLF